MATSVISMPSSTHTKKLGKVKNKIQSRGIEMQGDLTWKGWEPGKEYTKTLVLRNVHLQPKKIKYSTPSTRYFSILFPKQIILSAGTSVSLPVTFRPLDWTLYDDKIEFTVLDESGTNGGAQKLDLTLRAVLPVTKLCFPAELQLPVCAVGHTRSSTFELVSKGDLTTKFRWEYDAPFRIEPESGVIEPQKSITCTVYMTPQAAEIYVTEAVCFYGDVDSDRLDQKRYMAVEGMGKYAYLMLKTPDSVRTSQSDMAIKQLSFQTETMLDFGQIALGTKLEKVVQLCNPTAIDVPFSVQAVQSGNVPDSVTATIYQCAVQQGVVAANSCTPLPITFEPNQAGELCIKYFKITPIGSKKALLLKCCGTSRGPNVTLSTSLVDFKLVEYGQVAVSTLYLTNESDVRAIFHFQIDSDESVFKFEYVSGVLQAHDKRRLVLRFAPPKPIAYYKRVVCIVHNQGVLQLDLLGTCHSMKCEPPILERQHVDRFYLHMQRGLTRFPPEQLQELVKEGRLKKDRDEKSLVLPEAEQMEGLGLLDELPQLSDEDNFFFDGLHAATNAYNSHVQVEKQYLNFGSCTDMRQGAEVSLTIKNSTKGYIIVDWTTDESRVFSVQPDRVEIPPLKSTVVRVRFRPSKMDQYFGHWLEAFAYYKAMRHYSLVDVLTLMPPWCLNVFCSGNSFLADHQTFLPSIELIESSLVTCRAGLVGERVYKSLAIRNRNTQLPLLYSIDEETTGTFTMKPYQGMLKDEYTVVLTCCSLNTTGFFESQSIMRLHPHDTRYNQPLRYFGSADLPQVKIENDGYIYMRPTAVHSQSSRVFTIENLTRLPLHFECRANNVDSQVLRMYPSSGLLKGGEQVTIKCVFAPKRADKYLFKCVVVTRSAPNMPVTGRDETDEANDEETIDKPAHKTYKQMFPLRFIAQAVVGSISCEQSFCDMQSLAAIEPYQLRIHIRNDSLARLKYRLLVRQSIKADDEMSSNMQETVLNSIDPYQAAKIWSELQIDSSESVRGQESLNVQHRGPEALDNRLIRARCVETLLLAFCLQQRAMYTFDVYYQLLPDHEDAKQADSGVQSDADAALGEAVLLSTIVAKCVYPTMQVIDIRSHSKSTTRSISKKKWWDMFNCELLNRCLNADPENNELDTTANTRSSFSRIPDVRTRSIVEFNFSAAPIGSESTQITLLFSNTGTVPLRWNFLFPADLQLELEYWCESGKYTMEELHQLKVQVNHLFKIEPKQGIIEPGGEQLVTFSYEHPIAGTDRLPVLLKLEKGREVMINLCGATLHPDRKYLHFVSDKHYLQPMEVGQLDPPLQFYALYNGCAYPLEFEFDMSNVDRLNSNEHDHAVFQCMTPSGVIEPSEYFFTEWRFNPLEEKQYAVSVPIRIKQVQEGADGAAVDVAEVPVITLLGVGYRKDRMGATNPVLYRTSNEQRKMPTEQLIFTEHQVASLSHEIVVLGDVPLLCRVHRAIFVNNRLHDHAIRFQWHPVTIQGRSDIVFVKPESGLIEPRQSTLCHVYVNAYAKPALYDFDLLCEIVDHTLFEQYLSDFDRWCVELERQKNEFTISEANEHEDVELQQRLAQSRMPSNTVAILKRLSKFDQDRYKTLPPIRYLTTEQTELSDKLLKKLSEFFWFKPQPPSSSYLHLNVVMQTHEHGHYDTHFPGRLFNAHFLDRAELLRHSATMFGTRNAVNVSCANEFELDTLGHAVNRLVRDALDDENLKTAIKGMWKERTPYYCQITESKLVDQRRSTLAVEAASREPASLAAGGDGRSETTKSRQVAMLRGHRLVSVVASFDAEKKDAEMDQIRRIPEFVHHVGSILENTITNILVEAQKHEFSPTSRPRLIALPPKTTQSNTNTDSQK